MARTAVVYDSYRGDYGRLGSRKPPAGTFAATNMYVTADGSLCVRPGLKDITPSSGLATGKVWGFTNTPVTSHDGLLVIGNTVYTFNLLSVGAAAAGATTFASTPSRIVDFAKETTNVYVANQGDKVYKVDPTTPTVTALASAPGGACVAFYGDRMVVANTTSNFNRVAFSAALDYTSWPAANYFDVGDGWHISGLTAMRGMLIVEKQTGFHIVTGTLGVNEVLRQLIPYPGPVRPHQKCLTADNRVAYVPVNAVGPTFFDGARGDRIAYLDWTAGSAGGGNITADSPADFGVVNLDFGTTDQGLLFMGDAGDVGLLYLNGAWTKHAFGVGVSGFVCADNNRAYLCDGGGTGVTAKVYALDISSGTPGIEGSSFSKAGDASSTALAGSVTFPEWSPEGDGEVRVRGVNIEFTSFNTGSATTNHIDCTVDTLARYNTSGVDSSSTYVFDEAAASSSASGTSRHMWFPLADAQVGKAFQLRLTTVRGVSIQRVELVVDVEPGRAA